MPIIAPMKKPPMPTKLTAENTIMTIAQIICCRGLSLRLIALITTTTPQITLTSEIAARKPLELP